MPSVIYLFGYFAFQFKIKFEYIQGSGFNIPTNFNHVYFIFILFLYNSLLIGPAQSKGVVFGRRRGW